MTFSAKILGLLALSALVAGCGQNPNLKKLERLILPDAPPPPVERSSVHIDYKTPPAKRVSGTLKISLIIDTSGSNKNIPGPTGALQPGTDVDRRLRYDTLLNFLDSFSSYSPEDLENIYFSLITFNSAARRVSGFTNDLNAFKGIVQADKAGTTDAGATHMPAALQDLYLMIADDIEIENERPNPRRNNYVTIFVSDGVPQLPTGEYIQPDVIVAEVTKLKTLATTSQNVQSMTLHTGFYCNTLCDAQIGIDAASLMGRMADTGDGDFISFRNEGINFQRYALPVTKVKYQSRDVRVRNLSVAWYGNQLLADSDEDGISDEEEKEIKSNPNAKDTDGDGICDSVQRLISGNVCNARGSDGMCLRVSGPRYTACEPFRIPGPEVQYELSKDGYLNKCDLMQLNLQPESWESDDWMPHAIRLLAGLSFDRTARDLGLDPDKDGLTNYEEILLATNAFSPNNEHTPVYQYDLKLVHSGDSQDDYSLDITNISTVGENNHLIVYLLDHAPTGDTKRYVRVAKKRFDGKHLNFSPEDFR